MTVTPTIRPAVRLQRVVAAPPSNVYRAWLDPEFLRGWLAPGDLQVTRVEVDERVGGVFRIWQGSDDRDGGGFECELLELIENQRIAWRWGFVGPQRNDGPCYDSKLTVTLDEAPNNATTLTLVHEQLDALAAAMPGVANQVGQGWESVVDKLATTIVPGYVG